MKKSEAAQNQSAPIAIVGMSCLFPKAQSVQEYWSNIRRGVDAITEVPETHWRHEDYYDPDPKKPDHTYSKRGGFLSPVEFDPTEFGIAPTNLEATDASQLLGLLVAHGALMDAGYGPERNFNREKVSVILGVTGTLQLSIAMGARLGHPIWRRALEQSGITGEIAEEVVKNIGDAYAVWQENSFPGLLGNVVAGRIANRFNLGGTNCVVDAACASSISASHLAMMELTSGRADMVITGGADTFNDIFMYMCFSKTPALSPTGDAKPFDANADGTILGEGIGMVALKRLEDAERDGDKIYAVIKGIGTSSDGRGKAIYAPSSEGQQRCLEDAYRRAGVSPATVELVEAHGTGTKVGDAAEVSALKKIYRAAREKGMWCALGSVKSQIGHTKAAAGIAGLIKVALALKYKVLPPTIKVQKPNPESFGEESPFYVNTEKRPWLPRREHPRRAAVSAFGFGGSNFHAVLEEHRPHKNEIDWDGRVQIIALSSDDLAELKKWIGEWSAPMNWPEVKRRATETRRHFSTLHQYRLVVVAEQEKTDLRAAMKNALARIERDGDKKFWSTPEGAYFGKSRKPGKLAFLFPGQGSQYVGMCRDLVCLFPKMQEILTQADLAYGDLADLALQMSDFIFPYATFNEESKKLNELALRATHVAQPAIGAVSLGMVCLLTMFGAHPAMAAGHSFGELVALFTGGKIDAESLHQLANLRGRLMNEASKGDGGMLAVQASEEEARRVIEDEGLDVVIANKNAPKQIVLSGSKNAIEKAAEAFKRRKISCTALPVGAAFHSSLVAGAQGPFRAGLERVDFKSGDIAVYANSTAEPYPEDAQAARDLLAGQLARGVEFARMIERMRADGAETFVEVGPGAKLTGLVKAILGDGEYCAFALDASSGRGDGVADFARGLAQLASLGHDVDLKLWDPTVISENGPAQNGKPRMTVKLSGANYRNPAQAKGTATKSKNSSSAPVVAAPPIAKLESVKSPIPQAAQARIVSAPAAHVPPPPPEREANKMTHAPLQSTQTPNAFPSAPLNTKQNSGLIPAQRPAFEAAMRAAQENLLALQRMQEQTAQLHRQFLEGQQAAVHAMANLAAQQQQLYAGALGIIPPQIPAMPAQFAPIAAQPEAPILSAPSAAPFVPPRNGEQVHYAPSSPVSRPSHASSTLKSEQPQIPAPSRPAQTAGRGSDASKIKDILLEIVSEKTGYPAEMLNPEMDLESDLGIDSIKRVEILSVIQERLPEAPVVQPEQTGQLRTLGKIVEYLANGERASEGGNGRNEKNENYGKDAADGEKIGASQGNRANREASEVAGGEAEIIGQMLLEIVGEKTGYPAEMLNLGMDLESDLGIDSIKRVEILSVVQERLPDCPAVQPEDVGKFRTLGQIIEFLSSGGNEAEQGSAPQRSEAAAANEPSAEPCRTEFLSSDSQTLKRTVLSLERIEEPNGHREVKIREGAEIWINDDDPDLSGRLAERLKHLGFNPRVVSASGLELLEGINPEGLVLIAPASRAQTELWSEESEAFLKRAFALTQRAAKGLREAARQGGALFVTVSRMDGGFGLASEKGEFDPIQGGLAGLSKSARHEWNGVACKAIDVDPAWIADDAAVETLAEEFFRGGPAEVGLSGEGRFAIVELDSPLAEVGGSKAALETGDVVVVTGGARGVTAEAAIAIARATHAKLVLLGRSEYPQEEPNWLRGLTQEGDMKRAIAANANGHGTSPKHVQGEYRRWLANREIAANLERIRAAGSEVYYDSVDIGDAEAVKACLDSVRAEHGPIRGLVHGAGILADRLIEDKTPEQFAAVLETKVAGLRHILSAIAEDELKVMALFSSVSGRYGRKGQSDYAMANEALNKIARAQAARYPNRKVVSVNWGPWAGGMVNDGLAKLFAAEGIGLIPLEAGAEFLVRELATAENPIEVIASANMPPVELRQEHVGNGNGANGENGRKRKETKLRPAFERLVGVENHEFLRSHVINGNPVLPVAVIMEWLGHGALHQNPGLMFHGMRNLKILKGVILEGARPVRINVSASKAKLRDGELIATVELRGTQTGNGEHEHLHAAAEIILGESPPKPPPYHGKLRVNAEARDQSKGTEYSQVEHLYREILFHGEHLRGIEEIGSLSSEGIIAHIRNAPAPAVWMEEPIRSGWLADPLVLDAAFQAMIAWTRGQFGAASLPCAIAEYRQFQRQYPAGGASVSARASRNGSNIARADMDILDSEGGLIAKIAGYECVMDPTLAEAFRRNTILNPAAS